METGASKDHNYIVSIGGLVRYRRIITVPYLGMIVVRFQYVLYLDIWTDTIHIIIQRAEATIVRHRSCAPQEEERSISSEIESKLKLSIRSP